MRPIWKGAISFGLVSIPVSLFSAVKKESLRFRLLRKKDLSPVNYKRVAEADGKEVPWDEIVKGYEYEKDKFVVIKDEDFNRVDVEATQTVDIINFVKLEEVNPLLFDHPYYLQPEKGGDKAYVLLREALETEEKIAISKVVIKTRQHLAAIKPDKNGLMLELMHFPDELLSTEEFKTPKAKTLSKSELKMAKELIDKMSSSWKPDLYNDEYRNALEKVIEEKIKHGEKSISRQKKKKLPSNVVDLVSVLQQSIKDTESKPKSSPKTKRSIKHTKRKKKAA